MHIATEAHRVTESVEAARATLRASREIESGASSASKLGARAVEKGKEGVELSRRSAEARGESILGKEVTVELPSGNRSRPDLVTQAPNGEVTFVEAKNGPSARLSSGQRELQRTAEQGGTVVPRGKNAAAAGLKPGEPVPAKFRVDHHNQSP